MEASEIILTPEGKQKLVDELAFREGEKDAEIIERLKEARAFGDLSENAEYDAAKEEQSKNAARIAEIRKILSIARVSTEQRSGRAMVASLGCKIELEDASGNTSVYTIVGTTETNSLEKKISNESPLGAAIIGHKKGESITMATPSGATREFVIKKISR